MPSFKGLQLTKGDKGTTAAWTDLTNADLMDGGRGRPRLALDAQI